MEILYEIGRDSGVQAVMTSAWGWPAAESIHFIGLSLLLGTVGLFDLRMLGVGKGIRMGALHRLVRWGVAGYLLNVGTGALFVLAAPDQYLYNPAFQTKLALMAVAGANVVLFYAFTFAAVKRAGPQAAAPPWGRVAAVVSLTCWVGVIVCGRLITVFRPPYHWCFWC